MIKIKPTDAARRLLAGARQLVRDTKEDIRMIQDRDPAAKGDLEVLLTSSGLHAITAHRISHALYKKEHYLTARLISQGAKLLTGIEIHPGATIGRGLFIDHGTGVVIGETTEIGDNCTLYQGVTLGGTGKETGKRHPTLKDNVMVGAGAKILGAFTIGENSKIAANAVVLCEVPDNCTAVGIPAKVVRRGGERVNNNRDMDQTHIPDPISAELAKLAARIAELEGKNKEGNNSDL